MRTKIILLFAGLILCQISFAQNDVAILKFTEAEEAFSNYEFTTTLKKLDEVEKILGKSNPKILYLRIMAEEKNISVQDNIDLENISLLRIHCISYLKNNKEIEGIEEKYKEVYKVFDSYKDYEPFDTVVKGAKAGKVDDIVTLGRAYKMVSNTQKATEWLMLGVTQQNALAMVYMGRIASETGIEPDFTRDQSKAISWYTRAANLNEPLAMYYLGLAQYSGLGVPKDTTMGNAWLTKCFSIAIKEAKKGNARMMLLISSLYGTPMYKNDSNQAFTWCSKAVDTKSENILDFGNSLQTLGDKYAYAAVDLQNFDKAQSCYEKAISYGNFIAIANLENLYQYKTGDQRDDKKVFELNLRAAQRGNLYRMAVVGNSYRFSKGVERDYRKALYWYLKAARKGASNSMNIVGDFYRDGIGVDQNYLTARDWYLKAAERDYDLGYFSLGYLYYYGKGVSQNYNTALQWFTKGAEKNNNQCMYYLAHCYRYGLKDNSKALEWYNKTMNNGGGFTVLAINAIGDFYYEGLGVKKDYYTAFEYYQKAADKGNTDAMEKLVAMYSEGKGIKRNKALASEWQVKYETAKSKQ